MQRLVLLIAFFAGACSGPPDDGRQQPPSPLIAETASSPAAELAKRQREFLSAMADPDQDPSGFVTWNVTIFDHARTDIQQERVESAARPAHRSDYLRLLSKRLPSHQLNATRFEILRHGDSAYSVFSFQDSVLPMQTAWLKQGGDWKVWGIRLNVPPELVQQYRETNRRLAVQ